MKDMTIREKIIFLILGAIAIGAICYSWDRLLVRGILAQYRVREEYRAMMTELAVLFCLWVLILRLPVALSIRTIGTTIIMAIFLWIHRMLVPVVIAGIYMGFMYSRRLASVSIGRGKGKKPWPRISDRQSFCCMLFLSDVSIRNWENFVSLDIYAAYSRNYVPG